MTIMLRSCLVGTTVFSYALFFYETTIVNVQCVATNALSSILQSIFCMHIVLVLGQLLRQYDIAR